MKPVGRWAKRVGVGLGVLGLLLVGVALTVPFFVEVDHYRPDLLAKVNEQINGRVEMGKLTLSLWGEIRINVDGVRVADADGHDVLSSKDVYFHVSFWSVLSGSPVLTLRVKHPEIQMVKNRAGKFNALTLMKEPATPVPAEPTTPTTPAEPPSAPTKLPGMAKRARIGIEVQDAQLSYQDEATGGKTHVRNLNLVLKDISLSHPMDGELWADLHSQMASLKVEGPFRVTLHAVPKMETHQFEEVLVQAKADCKDIAIQMGESFEKKKGMECGADAQVKATPLSVTVEKLVARFFNAELTVEGSISQLSSTNANEKGALHFAFQSNSVSLSPWSQLVPLLKAYHLGGEASASGHVGGSLQSPKYDALVLAKAVTLKAPKFKSEPRIDGSLKIVTDQVQDLNVTLKGPGNDLKIQGKVVSFTKPKVDLVVTSTGMDLDQWIEFPKKTAKDTAAAPPSIGAATGTAAADAPQTDYDAWLDTLRKNTIAAATVANLRVNLAFMKAYNVRMAPLAGEASFKSLTLVVDTFHLGVFGGSVSSNAAIEMRPKMPTYRFNLGVDKLDLKQAVASQFEWFKNTLVGTAEFKMEGKGASFNPDPAKANLSAHGSMKVDHATFATIDIGKIAVDAVHQALGDLASKIPNLKEQMVKPLSTESKYEVVSSDFSIDKGVFSAPHFVAKAEPSRGLDVKGATTVGMKDYALNAEWEVTDTYDLLGIRNLSVEQAGIRVNHILSDGGPVRFPIKVGGTALSPQINYGSVPEALGKVALANVGQALQAKAKAEIQNQIGQQVQQLGAPKPIQDALQNLGKHLFGN